MDLVDPVGAPILGTKTWCSSCVLDSESNETTVLDFCHIDGLAVGATEANIARARPEDVDSTQDLPFRAQDHHSPFSITRYIQVPLFVVAHSIKTMVGKLFEQSFRGKRSIFLDLKPPDFALLGFIDR